MSITVGRLELAQPLLNGSGTWDAEQAHRIFGEANPGLAGFVTKTITPEPRAGNPAPRIAPSRQGLLNSIGLPGPGREALLATLLPHLRTIVSARWVGFLLPIMSTRSRRSRATRPAAR